LRDRKRDRATERERQRERVCVFERVCLKERERERNGGNIREKVFCTFVTA
jgi:hypothetical protein